MITERMCRKCLVVKSVKEFNTRVYKGEIFYKSQCRPCVSVLNAERYTRQRKIADATSINYVLKKISEGVSIDYHKLSIKVRKHVINLLMDNGVTEMTVSECLSCPVGIVLQYRNQEA